MKKNFLVLGFGFFVSDVKSGVCYWPLWLMLPGHGPNWQKYFSEVCIGFGFVCIGSLKSEVCIGFVFDWVSSISDSKVMAKKN